MAFMIVHEHDAPHNATRFELTKLKSIGVIKVEFFNQNWPDVEATDIKPNTFRTAMLELDVLNAIKLRNALTEAIDDIMINHSKKLEKAIEKASTLKDDKLKNHLRAYIDTSLFNDD